jgi:hypothetical protein
MGEIGNIGDLDLENYHIDFLNWNIDIENYCTISLKMLPFEDRNVKIKSIQFDTKRCFLRYLEIRSSHVSVLDLYLIFVLEMT